MKRTPSLLVYLILSLVFSLHANAQTEPPVPQASFSPAQFDRMLCSQRCFNEDVQIALPPLDVKTVTKLDVVILIDNSSSMGNVISSAQRGSQRIVEGVKGLVEDTRFAIGTFSDYVDVPWRLYTDFSTSLATISGGIDTIQLLGGGDEDESYGRALWEVSRLKWRDDSARVVIVFTDASPKDPDPGFDGENRTGDEILFSNVVNDLIQQEIRLVGVNSGGDDIPQLRRAAEQTDGLYIDISDVNTIPETIVNLLQGILETYRIRFTAQDAAQTDWFSQSPVSFDYPKDGKPVSISLQFCPTEHHLSNGNYPVSLSLDNRSTHYGSLPLTFQYYQQCANLTIQDTPEDDGNGCSADLFWESPAIAIRNAPDATYNLGKPVTGKVNYVFLQINNNGPEATSNAQLTLYDSSDLLPSEFPQDWHVVATQAIHLDSGKTEWFGPLAWTPQNEITSLRAQVEEQYDPITQEKNTRCDGNIAQVNRVDLTLDNYSIIPGYAAGRLPLSVTLPTGLNRADLTINADALSSDGIVQINTNKTNVLISDNERNGTLLTTSLINNLRDAHLTLGALSPVQNGAVYISLRDGSDTLLGTTIYVASLGAIKAAPVDSNHNEQTLESLPVLLVAGTIAIIFALSIIFAIIAKKQSHSA